MDPLSHSRFALLSACALAALMSVAPMTARAEGEPEKVTSGAAPSDHSDDGSREEHRANHIKGHIAFLKAELMITPAQEAAWDKVADAMTDDVEDYQAAAAKTPETQSEPSAVDSLTQRQQFAELRAKGEKRFLNAFKPLYDSFSTEQKHVADDMFATRSGD